jgi:hypothetical protein
MVNRVLSEAGAGFRQTFRAGLGDVSFFHCYGARRKALSPKSWKRHFGSGHPFGPGSVLRHPRIAVPEMGDHLPQR